MHEEQDLHGKIMNIPCNSLDAATSSINHELAYKQGHRDARHAAAELVLASLAKPQPVGGALPGTASALAFALSVDIKDAINELADGQHYPDLLESVDRLATLSAPVAQPIAADAPLPVAEVAAGKYGNRLMWHFDGAQESTPVGTMLYAAAPAQAAAVPEAVDAIKAALALFPISWDTQSFRINSGPLLEADGDTEFYSKKRVGEFIVAMHGHLKSAADCLAAWGQGDVSGEGEGA